MDTLILSRIQFGANISFHILFPTITIALGWVLLFFKLRFAATGEDAWMQAYRFWVKVFALSFAMGVVSGITMSFQFGTNWPGFMETVGNVAGPLLAYEVMTAFFLEAVFLGIMLFGYAPVALMLIGLILRGVAFEFRVKAPAPWKNTWNAAFFGGSLVTSLSQGYMLGLYIMGLETTWATVLFAVLAAVFLTIGYSFIGAAWLILKTDGLLQRKAVDWAKGGIWGLVLGLGGISIASPLVSERIFNKWFSVPEFFLLAPLPLMSLLLIALIWVMLRRLPMMDDKFAWVPFAASIALFALAFFGMAYSFYPYVVPEKLTIYEAASAPESLFIILIGTIFVLPMIAAYTALAYIVFRGKATELRYD
jgi:cytochrome d ubiquinol oxidase subunit II